MPQNPDLEEHWGFEGLVVACWASLMSAQSFPRGCKESKGTPSSLILQKIRLTFQSGENFIFEGAELWSKVKVGDELRGALTLNVL